MALVLFGSGYTGNLKKFLDNTMGTVNANWPEFKPKVEEVYQTLNRAIENLEKVLGPRLIGRKIVGNEWEARFNRVLFEVEAFYFRLITPRKITTQGKRRFIAGLKRLFENAEFRSSVEATTKTNERYELRFQRFQELVNKSFDTTIDDIPVKA